MRCKSSMGHRPGSYLLCRSVREYCRMQCDWLHQLQRELLRRVVCGGPRTRRRRCCGIPCSRPGHRLAGASQAPPGCLSHDPVARSGRLWHNSYRKQQRDEAGVVKQLTLHHKRWRQFQSRLADLLPQVVFVLCVAALPVHNASAVTITCYDNSYAAVSCSSPSAESCTIGGASNITPECINMGYTGISYGEFGPGYFVYRCVSGPGCGAAAVPELEDYTVALFLGLALLIGWQVRPRPAA